MKGQKTLIIDDNNENLKVAARILKNDDLQIIVSNNAKKGIQIAKEIKPDLILLDIQMPEMDGYEVCRTLKEDESVMDIPVIFMTASTDERSIKEAYRSGGVDYIVKPVRKYELISRVQTHLKLSQVIKALELAAVTDGLTGLFNHNRIFEILDHEIKRSVRYKEPFCILMADIDKFKSANDTYGHHFGDDVLVSVSKCLRETVRETDYVGRYGGEEFLIIMPNTSLNAGKEAAERIRKKVSEIDFDNDFKLTISGGVIEFDESLSALEMVDKADKFLYMAKENGRNQMVSE